MPKKPLSTDVTSTVTTPSLAKKLAADFSDITFISDAPACAWNADESQITYRDDTPAAELLHEVGHALLGHKSYSRDIELLRIERDAWDYAIKELSPRYGIAIDTDTAEDALDTYREWLHDRSTCPSCHTNGIQDTVSSYRCIQCHKRWSVNDGRVCQLRRKLITKK